MNAKRPNSSPALSRFPRVSALAIAADAVVTAVQSRSQSESHHERCLGGVLGLCPYGHDGPQHCGDQDGHAHQTPHLLLQQSLHGLGQDDTEPDHTRN